MAPALKPTNVTPPAAPALAIYLFGQPRLAFNNEPFKFASRPKTLSLLAYLLLHRAGPVSREKVAFTLWEDDTEEDARANLRRHLHHLLRALPPAPADAPWIITDADTAQWNPQANAWVDVSEFERLAATSSGRAEAVDLYTGELLESSYDEWLFADRDRLRNTYLSILGELSIEARGRRDLARSAGYAQRILANDPWREDTVRQLMSVRYESGDRAGALAVYQQFDRRLREEMNVDPMPETSALRDVVLRDEPLPSPVAGAFTPAVAATGSPLLPFVGRDAEMEQLRVLWSRAARGRGQVVLIGGEAGVGKSRLASEFALLAETQGARVMIGATAYPESAPYQAISEAFRGVAPLIASLPMQRIWLGVIAQAVPELRARISDLPDPPKVEPDRERNRLFEAFSTGLEALSRPRPLVIVLEDMHWAGDASVAAMQFIARRLSALPVLIIVTYRDEETPRTHPLRRVRRELQEEHLLAIVSPRNLRREAVAELLERTPSMAGVNADVDALLERSAGNPLFLGEVIQGVLEGSDSDAKQPPQSVKQAIMARAARLPESSKALAEVAVVIGQGFNVELVRDVAGWSENDVLDALNGLIDRHFVKETGGRSGYAYAFSHHLIQSTIYAGVAPEVRARRHRRVARALEESYQDRPGQFAADVARHYELGGEAELAGLAFLRAARYANDVYAYDEALRYLERSLELAHEQDTRRRVFELRESIRALRGDRVNQGEDLKELERIAGESGNIDLVCDVLRRKALFARALGERDLEGSLVKEFVARAADSNNRALRAASYIALAAYATMMSNLPEARKAAETALQLYRELGDAAGQIEARCRLVEVVLEGGAFDVASQMLAEVRASGEAAENQRLFARVVTSATHVAITEQRYAECRDLAEEARGVYQSIGDREGEADVTLRQASAAARLSMLEEARRCYEEARTIYQAIGKRLGVAAVLANSGIHSVRLGLLDEAERSLRAAADQFTALKDLRGQAACAVNLSYVHLIRGAAADARKNAQLGLEIARSIPHPGYEAASLANLGGAERDLGNLDLAVKHMEAGLAIRRRLSVAADYADDLAHLAYAYVMAGKIESARGLSDELATSLEATSPTIFMPQFAYLAAAQAFRALGQRERALATLKKAHDIVVEQAAAISGPSERGTYLSLSVNKEIEAAAKSRDWPADPKRPGRRVANS